MPVQTEFSLIQQYFSALTEPREDVLLGIGDDCALLANPANYLLAVSVDTLVEGVHFLADVDPYRLGHKALAVNLSDLAAMGARPAWFTLALSLPQVDAAWLSAFSKGLGDLARQHQIQLVGGDTTRGPLTITIQVHGHVLPQHSLQRAAAQVGDWICVTGTLGDAAAGLDIKRGQLTSEVLSVEDLAFLVDRLECPTPRIQLGQQLAGRAHAAIDISDGLLADLQHILIASKVGACLDLNTIPLSKSLQQLPQAAARQYALTGGDDYELCFTAPAEIAAAFCQRAPDLFRRIGEIIERPGMFSQQADGQLTPLNTDKAGYDHFA